MSESEKDDILMEEVTPEDLNTEAAEFVPSSKRKRVIAWILFAIVIVGVALWLLNIAMPDWIEKVHEYFRN